MSEIFPQPIRNLPEADIPLGGITAYLSQAENHQILFSMPDMPIFLSLIKRK
jgi:molybdopterin-guanine dinucleotide biosynthesis protein A